MINDEFLLDNDHIERELPSSVSRELKLTGNWLLTITVITLIIGIISAFFFVVFVADISIYGAEAIFFCSGLFLSAGSCFYFAFWQFKLSRGIQWLEADYAQFDFEEVQRCSSKTWKGFGFMLLFVGLTIIGSVFFSVNEVSEEPTPSIREMPEPIISEPAQVDTTMMIPNNITNQVDSF